MRDLTGLCYTNHILPLIYSIQKVLILQKHSVVFNMFKVRFKLPVVAHNNPLFQCYLYQNLGTTVSSETCCTKYRHMLKGSEVNSVEVTKEPIENATLIRS